MTLHVPGRPPVVGIPCDIKMIGPHPFHAVGDKYVNAVRDGADAFPVLIPVTSPVLDRARLFEIVDGLLFTGAWSNVEPERYGGASPDEDMLLDPDRDRTTLPLIPEAIDRGVPVFCICRGFQELNVAYGGTLHTHLHRLSGRRDHRENRDDPLDVQYGPAHSVTLTQGGTIASLLGKQDIEVNSLHSQGIDRLAEGLVVEGRAEDGTIEAVRVDHAPAFALGVQWHPEWRVHDNPDYLALFKAFGEAVRRCRGATIKEKT